MANRDYVTDLEILSDDTQRTVAQAALAIGNALGTYSGSERAGSLVAAQRGLDDAQDALLDLARAHNQEHPDDLVPIDEEEDLLPDEEGDEESQEPGTKAKVKKGAAE